MTSTNSADERKTGMLLCLAVCSGLGVANVYYLQPALPLIQMEYGVSPEQVGWLPTLTQISYAVGMFFLAPLGDVIARRKLVFIKASVLAMALLAAGSSSGFVVLLCASAVVGILGSLGQDFIPVAAQLVPNHSRGRAVGIVTTGLLSGVLLSRTLGGLISETAGWREMQFIAAALMLAVLAIAWRILPNDPPASSSSYGRLISSLWTLWRTHRALRLVVLNQAVLSLVTGAFWSCIAFVLAAPPYNVGAAVAGSYGIAGAMGAMAASVFGRVSDTRGPLFSIRLGCFLVIIAFAAMAILPSSFLLLAIGAIVFDVGAQAGFVSHQMLVSGLDPQARSRTNALLMTGAMTGVATGAFLGNFFWVHGGAAGLFGFAAVAGVFALLISYCHRRV